MADILNEFWNWMPKFKETHIVLREIVKERLVLPYVAKTFTRIAGISGGIAVCMTAYGAHAFNEDPENTRLKTIFECGNKMHLIHSVALLGVPLTNQPKLIGSVMLAGMIIFSGTCYYQAIAGNSKVRQMTPYGGMLLILSWFLMLL